MILCVERGKTNEFNLSDSQKVVKHGGTFSTKKAHFVRLFGKFSVLYHDVQLGFIRPSRALLRTDLSMLLSSERRWKPETDWLLADSMAHMLYDECATAFTVSIQSDIFFCHLQS